ncbi:sarcosine oxidase subunit alpha family protein [Niveispirillum sp.]|uniref:sarcosine oxidase subunit alpha family protein n=1 Tax=Niveispirillum sp. TaxID=1917217 RepID=UPI001B776D10|nr:sarcosine oxidase subunit alpha family protein [Niveispirillum sp.]MBP7336568.1 sarcosine oxidase subunit alpha family protein [Niveispirillum sp.]
MSRLATGGQIDRSSPHNFTFDGRAYQGFAGDTLASALIANGVRLVGRSFKYHRPRGVLSAGPEEPNALVTLGAGAHREPNTRATLVELFDGLQAGSQNRWPNLRFDLLALNQMVSPLLVAGFYYKTFMWPASFWERVYEPLIRRAAGLGHLSTLPDPDHYDREHGFCDLLVIGGGPAGLASALAAGRAGLRVILACEDFRWGGRLLSERHVIADQAGDTWAAQVVEELASMPNVRMLGRTTIVGAYDGREYVAVERVGDPLAPAPSARPRQRLWKIVARETVLASGAIERPLVFGGNDRPGVMLASAVSSYINRFAAVPGKRAVIFTTGDSGWRTAADLIAAGAELVALADARDEVPAAIRALLPGGLPVHLGARIADAQGAPLRSVDLIAGGKRHRIGADLLAMAGGWNPAIGLGSNLGTRPIWSTEQETFLLDRTPPGLRAAGAANGKFALGDAIRDGWSCGTQIARALGRPAIAEQSFPTSDDPASGRALWHVGERRGKAFVDYQNDVTDKDIDLAVQEGFTSVEHLKRYTTLGMATDQGKTSGVNGHALLARATGRSLSQTGTILSRPPWQPVAIGALAGHHRGRDFRPERLTPSHRWAAERGAVFTDAGLWKRAQWFPHYPDEPWREAVDREVRLTRSGVGVCDVSTLGKIDIHGPDAAALLDRLYTGTFSTLGVGRARYGIMLREDGFIFDDGTTTRFAPDRYYLTTTTANAGRVMQHIDFARQVLWPELDVQAVSVTERWAGFSIAGPASRSLVAALLPDLDLSNAAFPPMAAMELSWEGMPARLFRLSFSGELAYELCVPAMAGDRLIRRLFQLGADLGITPYGTEALGVMRIEKGHVAGPELNGQTTAADLGMGRMVSTKKDFIGRVLAGRPALVDPGRPVLVGLIPLDRRQLFTAGAHLVRPGRAPVAANDEGHVTSVAHSPTLGHSIALALLSGGRGRHGERIVAHDLVRAIIVEAEICDPVFLDPEGVRVRG